MNPERFQEAAAAFDGLRLKILRLKAERRHGLDVRLGRIVRTLDLLGLQDVAAKKLALQDAGVTVSRRQAAHQVTFTAIIGAKPMVLRTYARLEQVGDRGQMPDGSGAGLALDALDDLEAEAEEAEAIDTAYAYTLESEWLAIEADLAVVLSGDSNPTCAPESAESPDGSVSGAPRAEGDNCLDQAAAAFSTAGTVLQRVWDKITANGSGLAELKVIISGLRGQIVAGALTAEAAIDLAAPLVVEFIAGLNIGWVLTGAAIAAAGYYLYRWGECEGWWAIEPEALSASEWP